MKTIRLPYKTTEDLTSIIKQYSNVVRYSYNRFLGGKTEKDIRLLTKSLNSIITSFTARIYGKRRSKRKTEQLIKELKSDD